MGYHTAVMNYTTTAIFENGLLRPNIPLDLPEHSEVEIIVRINDSSLRSKVRKALNLQVQPNKTENLISDKRREQVAKIFSSEKPLSDYIDEDRESR
jgi:predicted DNA-binding antitoxin AbrB/MazE fold protein